MSDESRPQKPTSARPTPVRRAMESHEEPAGQPDLASRSVELDGNTWVVRALGRGQGGSPLSAAPLLLLGFSRSEEGPVESEALVVSRSLEAMTECELEQAFHAAGSPPDPSRDVSLFAGTAERRTRKP